NVGHNVTINDGKGDGTNASRTQILNNVNTSARSVIKGNVSVTYQDGDVDEGIWDTEVKGSFALKHARGAVTTKFDGSSTSLPVLVRRSLSLPGSGDSTVTDGTQGTHTGLVVGGKFTVATPPGTPPGSPAGNLSFFNLQVGGDTNITLGNGNDTVI